jgi:hypothetical protein
LLLGAAVRDPARAIERVSANAVILFVFMG